MDKKLSHMARPLFLEGSWGRIANTQDHDVQILGALRINATDVEQETNAKAEKHEVPIQNGIKINS